MSMKIGTSKPMSAMGAAPSQQVSSPQKVKTTTGQDDMPAYIVELSEHSDSNEQKDVEKRHFQNFKSVEETFTEGSEAEFREKWLAAQRAFSELVLKENGEVLETLDPLAMESYIRGDDQMSWDISFELKLQGSVLHNPLFSEANTRFERYRNIAGKIRAGGEETFRWYNLKFAGMAAYANTTYMDGELQKRIARGHTTMEEYARAKSYASELQNRAGVFVAPDFSVPAEDFAEGIRYSYNGSLANIGVKLLAFMSQHREADDVWVKAAQGAYKNRAEIATALKDAGLNDTAVAYHDFVSSTTSKGYTIDKAMTMAFVHENGSLWNAVIGDNKVYAQLQRSARSNDTSTMRYTQEEMNRSLADGADEIEFLSTVDRQRKPAHIIQLSDGRWVRIEETEVSDQRVHHRDNPLETELRNLRKQLAEIKKSAMSDDQKQPLIESIKNRINTVQAQLLSELQDSSKKSKDKSLNLM